MNQSTIILKTASRKEAVYYAPECDVIQSAMANIICGSGDATAPAFNNPEPFTW